MRLNEIKRLSYFYQSMNFLIKNNKYKFSTKRLLKYQ